MARGRWIKPEFCSDKKLAAVSRDARLLFIGMWMFSDDYGVIKAKPSWIQANVFEEDDTAELPLIKKWLIELEKIGAIIKFTADGKEYYFIRTFLDHQKVDKPSKTRNPEPPSDILDNVSRDSSETVDAAVEVEREVEVENKVEIEVERGTSPVPVEAPAKKESSSIKDPAYIAFKTLCDTRKLEMKVSQSRYLELRDEYSLKVGASFWQEIQKCVNWCYDNQKKKITTSRLRNWLVNAVKFAKEREIKQRQEYQDKKNNPIKKPLAVNQIPVWTPPL